MEPDLIEALTNGFLRPHVTEETLSLHDILGRKHYFSIGMLIVPKQLAQTHEHTDKSS